jgi:peroxiredoxin
MSKRFAYPFLCLGISLFSLLAREDKDYLLAPLRVMNGAHETVRYYIPKRLALRATPREPGLRLPAFHASPRFATLVAGSGADSLITVVIDESAAYANKIYIDRNNDENLTNDGAGEWNEARDNYLATSTMVSIHDAPKNLRPLAFRFYRFDKRLPDVLFYYRDYFAKGALTLGEERYDVALVDDNADGRFNDLSATTLLIDGNRDGKLDGTPGSAEIFGGRESFLANGESYLLREVAADGRWAKFAVSPNKVANKADLTVGGMPPEFSMNDLDGRPLRLAEYRGRIILLHFWATWCKPCVNEFPQLLEVYRGLKSHDDRRAANANFEIIGISLDDDRQTLKNLIEQYDIPWPQLFDGQGWNSPIARQYRLSSLPRTFLIDDNGAIRYVDVRGNHLANAIAQLMEKR